MNLIGKQSHIFDQSKTELNHLCYAVHRSTSIPNTSSITLIIS